MRKFSALKNLSTTRITIYANIAPKAKEKKKCLQGSHHPASIRVWGCSSPVVKDVALAFKVRMIQWWLRKNVPGLIGHEDWFSGRQELNPLSYSLWSVLEEKMCQNGFPIRTVLNILKDSRYGKAAVK
ncbi:hypothetical protein TNCV_2977951 [Trichonephila clavipes]|nr:hypothetical protein TNCV_2977951 [Trichonephila clavipes]